LQEARALLGRCEYRKGNIEVALYVFEGIDIAAVTSKIKVTLARAGEHRRRRSRSYDTPPMSINSVSLLLEAIFLKAKSLQSLGRLKGTNNMLIYIFFILLCRILDLITDTVLNFKLSTPFF
jgi:hypothetical protein